MNSELFVGLLRSVVNGHRAHELGEHQPRVANFFRDSAHGDVAHIFHGREYQGTLDLDISYLETCLLHRGLWYRPGYKGAMTPDDSPVENTEEITKTARQHMDQLESEYTEKFDEISQRVNQAKATRAKKQAQASQKLEKENEANKGLGYGLAIAYAVMGMPLAGLGVGYLLDKAFGTQSLQAICAGVGFILGMGYVVILSKRLNGDS